MKVSFIVPGYKCDEYIFRNIDSILDQDYKNYEIIVVLNGQWETKDELSKSIKEKYVDKVILETPEWSGLGRANNYGTMISTGDAVACLSSDLYLMPGALRTWIDSFKDNPDCDFVYSGYKFVSDNPLDIYHSNSFNRYHLECENFIDGANPVKRKALARWNEDLPSLIDWDYFLSVTDHGAKGYYIKEPLYYAEFPKKGGLSEDSSSNWIRRRRDIQSLHHIHERNICVTSLYDPDYALEIAQFCDADYRIYPGFKPHNYSLVYCYGFMCDMDNIQRSTGVFFQHHGHKAIQWVGHDIRTLMNLRWYDADMYSQSILSRIGNHFCFNQMDQKILDRMRIEAEILYTPFVNKTSEKKELISVNSEALMSQLKKAMPDQTIVLNDLDCKTTIHYDDKYVNVIKSLCKGNRVITTSFISGVYYIHGFTNVPELRKMIVHTIRKINRDSEEIDPETVKFYKERTLPNTFKTKLERIADKPIRKYGRLEEIQASA